MEKYLCQKVREKKFGIDLNKISVQQKSTKRMKSQ